MRADACSDGGVSGSVGCMDLWGDSLLGTHVVSIPCSDPPLTRVTWAIRADVRAFFFFFFLLHRAAAESQPSPHCTFVSTSSVTTVTPRVLSFPRPRFLVYLHVGKGHKLPSGPTGGLDGRRRCCRTPVGAGRLPPPPRWLPAATAGRLPAAGLPTAAAIRWLCSAAAGLPHRRGGAAARGVPAAAATAGLCRRSGTGVCKPAGSAAAKG